jgi:hypothetical protein
MNISSQYYSAFPKSRYFNTNIPEITSAFKTASSPAEIPAAQKNNQIVYIPDEKTLYSGGNGTGLSCIVKYSDEYSKENPVVTVSGIDENNKAFKYEMNINDIDPTNATYIELKTLGAYLGYGFSETALIGMGEAKMNDRMNVFEQLDEKIRTCQLLKLGGHELNATLIRNDFSNWMKQKEK